MFHIKYVVMLMIHLHTKFHMSGYNGPLSIVIKPKTKYKFRAASRHADVLDSTDHVKEKCIGVPSTATENFKTLH